MCGICGKLYTNEAPVEETLIRAMARTLIHRGPDAEGYHFEPHIGLGFRRLAIIDLVTGDQPVQNEDGSVVVIFNGEIYNFRELRAVLEQCGHLFRTRSDTEVIVHAYEEYAQDFVEHLEGQFAIAIWDRRNSRLVLARDRLGQKPLFYAQLSDSVVFASELKALLQDDTIPCDLSATAIDRYLTYRYVASDKLTIFKHVFQLAPAHVMIFHLGDRQPRTYRYWSPLKALERPVATREEIGQLLREAVRKRMISDVPLGAFLSGGIDSSIIVALMAGLSDKPIRTFTIGFSEQAFNETDFARTVAEHLQTDHHELVLNLNVADVLPDFVWYSDQPIGDAASLPTYFLSKLARQHITVALNGDGGDESFAGYRHYQSVLRTLEYAKLPHQIRGGAAATLLGRFAPESVSERLDKLNEYARLPLPVQFSQRMLLTQSGKRLPLYQTAFAQELHEIADDYLPDCFVHLPQASPLTRMLMTDLLSIMPGSLLVKMDRMSMGNSLEVRSPFLDHKLIEAALALPDKQRMLCYTQGKRLLRNLYRDLLPATILKRRKAGFSVPLDDWFRGGLRPVASDLLLGKRFKERGIFSHTSVKTMLDQHWSGTRQHGALIWAMTMLEFWFQRFLDDGVRE